MSVSVQTFPLSSNSKVNKRYRAKNNNSSNNSTSSTVVVPEQKGHKPPRHVVQLLKEVIINKNKNRALASASASTSVPPSPLPELLPPPTPAKTPNKTRPAPTLQPPPKRQRIVPPPSPAAPPTGHQEELSPVESLPQPASPISLPSPSTPLTSASSTPSLLSPISGQYSITYFTLKPGLKDGRPTPRACWMNGEWGWMRILTTNLRAKQSCF